MNEQTEGSTPEQLLKKPEKPEGMSQEEWERMSILWGAIKGLTSPPSEVAQQAAGGDKGMEAIFQMTEGILKAGEELGMPAAKIQLTIEKTFEPKEKTSPPQSTIPTSSGK